MFNRQTDRQTNKQTNKQTDGQTDRRTDGRTDGRMDGQTDKLTGRQTVRHAGRQTNKQTNRSKNITSCRRLRGEQEESPGNEINDKIQNGSQFLQWKAFAFPTTCGTLSIKHSTKYSRSENKKHPERECLLSRDETKRF